MELQVTAARPRLTRPAYASGPDRQARRILLITHAVDFGNYVFANNLVRMFQQDAALDLQHHAFSSDEVEYAGRDLSKSKRFVLTKGARIRESLAMRHLFGQARREGRVIVYQGISPALFCTPWHRGCPSYVILDWTRKLYEPIRNKRMSPAGVTLLHKAILRRSVSGVVGLTDAVVQSLLDDYETPASKVHKGRMPFDVEGFEPSRDRDDGVVRILFVGGEFYRKGGDRLLEWYRRSGAENVELTIVTQSDVEVPDTVRLIRNDPKFSPADEFSRNDLFVLPTRYDAYPQVLGEAASAGLGIITTDTALGASEIIDPGKNGFVVAGDGELQAVLDRVVGDADEIRRLKGHSRRKMAEQFSYSACYEAIAPVVFKEVVTTT